MELYNLPAEVIEYPAFNHAIARKTLNMPSDLVLKFISAILQTWDTRTWKNNDTYRVFILRPSRQKSNLNNEQFFSLSLMLEDESVAHYRLSYIKDLKLYKNQIGYTSQKFQEIIKTIFSGLKIDFRPMFTVPGSIGPNLTPENIEKFIFNAVRISESKPAQIQKIIPREEPKVFSDEFHRLSLKSIEGDMDAQESLAYLHIHGIGCPINIEEGLKWRESSAKQGNSISKLNLGLYYQKKDTVQDLKIAITYFSSLALTDNSEFAKEKLKQSQIRFWELAKSI
jgi:TPR repeat protein